MAIITTDFEGREKIIKQTDIKINGNTMIMSVTLENFLPPGTL